MKINIEKTTQGIRLSKIVYNQLVQKHYIGYNLKEAKELFKKDLKEEK